MSDGSAAARKPLEFLLHYIMQNGWSIYDHKDIICDLVTHYADYELAFVKASLEGCWGWDDILSIIDECFEESVRPAPSTIRDGDSSHSAPTISAELMGEAEQHYSLSKSVVEF